MKNIEFEYFKNGYKMVHSHISATLIRKKTYFC